MLWPKIVATVLIVALAATVALLLGARSWRSSIVALDTRLRVGAAASTPLSEVPEVVASYLARAVPEGASPIRFARLEQQGQFRMGDDWKPFTAVEVFSGLPPAFYWDAKIQMLPLVPVRVRDSYVQGEAGMVARIGGIVTMMNAPSDQGLREGALMRYLAEAVWIPTRLASGPGLTWTAVGADRALAQLTDGGTTVSLEFTFDTQHDQLGVSGIRKREVDGAYIDTPWVGRFSEHAVIDGYRIPTYGEVAWVIDGVETPYWKGSISSAEFLAGSAPSHP